MTEIDWFESVSPESMLDHLGKQATAQRSGCSLAPACGASHRC